MVVGRAPQRPSEFAVRICNRVLVDAGDAPAHQAVLVEFPVLIAIGTKPIVAVVVELVGEAYCDPVAAKVHSSLISR